MRTFPPVMFRPGDLIESPGHTQTRLYQVAGVFLGGVGQESTVQLYSVDRGQPSMGATLADINVPIEMLESGIESGLFIHTP